MARPSPPPVARIGRDQVLGMRWTRHQLHRPQGAGDPATLDVDLLDVGVQDTGPDGSSWALAVRGLEPEGAADGLALAWTVRGAPHAYRRSELAAIAVATAPWEEADAAKRIFDAAKPLRAAGIAVLDALRTIAGHLRELAESPIAKGDASGALNALLPEPYLRDCRPCRAHHIYELPFRLAALQAGLELEPATSPPVLRRIPDLTPNLLTHLAGDAEPNVDLVRGALRFWGPTTPKDVAALLDVPVTSVKARWPDDAVPVEVRDVEGRGPAWILDEDVDLLVAGGGGDTSGTLRLLGPYDPYVQGRDRPVLVPDGERRAELWPVLGRPGAVAVDGRVVGTWRPRTHRGTLSVRVQDWDGLARHRAALDAEGARLAAHRGVAFGGCEDQEEP